MSFPLLALDSVTIGYPGNPVLRDVTLEIFPGQALAVLGPNGSGKTAFLKTIAGVLQPLAGTVRFGPTVEGKAMRVGYVPQRATVSGLLPLTVREVAEMGTYGSLRPWQRLGREERERVKWAMAVVGIDDLKRKSYSELSGGQQQRVLIARALATDPAVLVMDEPLASLDRETVQAMVSLLVKLRSEPGLTMLWADHFVPALHEVVREVMLIEDTKLIHSKIEVVLERDQQSVKFKRGTGL